ncbi:MAG: hypothetical protein L0Z62_48210 [Gemmataceae bacterium]|nr:hypothetical protein [Gemmataceae bacterium]
MLWRTALMGVVIALAVSLQLNGAAEAGGKGDGTYIKVEVKGRIKTGIVAIGGETTGTIITTAAGTLELDLSKNKELREQAEKLNGKVAVAQGTLSIRKGVTVRRERLIVTVMSLRSGE